MINENYVDFSDGERWKSLIWFLTMLQSKVKSEPLRHICSVIFVDLGEALLSQFSSYPALKSRWENMLSLSDGRISIADLESCSVTVLGGLSTQAFMMLYDRLLGDGKAYAYLERRMTKLVEQWVKFANTYFGKNDNVIHLICEIGIVSIFDVFIKKEVSNLNEKNTSGETPLIIACALGHEQIVDRLIKIPELDVKIAAECGMTALWIAVCCRREGIVKLLILHKDIEINKTLDGDSPLIIAIHYNVIEIVKQILSHPKIEINLVCNGITALWAACDSGNERTVDLLLKIINIDSNLSGANVETPLCAACQRGHTGVVMQMLAHSGIDVNKTFLTGGTPLWHACEQGNNDVVRLLTARPEIDINSEYFDGAGSRGTPLFVAVLLGKSDIVRTLLYHETIDINKMDGSGATALYMACALGHSRIVRLLLRRKDVDINKRDVDGITPLIIACVNGNYDVVRRLINHKEIDVNQCWGNESALSVAIDRNYNDIVRLLASHPKMSGAALEKCGISTESMPIEDFGGYQCRFERTLDCHADFYGLPALPTNA